MRRRRSHDRWQLEQPLGEQLAGVSADILSRCGVGADLLARPAGSLSGGQKTRAALARVLAGKPQVLLLDEPTNHLDVAALGWLEGLLVGYPGAALVVSHDRYFLDRIATRVLELAGGRVREYPGNYSAYARQKQAEREKAQGDYRQYAKEKQHLEAAIRRQQQWAQASHPAEVTSDMPMNARGFMRSQARAHLQAAKSMAQRLERIKVEKPREAARINLRVDSGEGVGRHLVLARGLGFIYPGARAPVFTGADFFVQRGDRVAVVGPNGSGKTTRVEPFTGGYEEFVHRSAAAARGRDETAERVLLLETRLASLSAALAAPKPGEAERLNAEFLAVSRELRVLKGAL